MDAAGKIISQEELISPLPIIKTLYNGKYFPKRGEVNTLPSLTIPDEAMSISELVKRFANGMPLDGGRLPQYDGEEEMTDLERLDLSERKAFIEEHKAVIEKVKSDVAERREAAEKKRLDDIIEERVQKKLAEQKQEKGGSNEPV